MLPKLEATATPIKKEGPSHHEAGVDKGPTLSTPKMEGKKEVKIEPGCDSPKTEVKPPTTTTTSTTTTTVRRSTRTTAKGTKPGDFMKYLDP